jgi:hypothetical protein
MISPTRIECAIRTMTKGDGYRPEPLPVGRVPRIARLLALAHKLDNLLRQHDVPNCAALARLGHVSRARISQITNLLNLAPDIQEAILYLPLTVRGRDPIRLRQLQTLTQVLDWSGQRALWQELCRGARDRPPGGRDGTAFPSRRARVRVVRVRAPINRNTVTCTGKDDDGQV